MFISTEIKTSSSMINNNIAKIQVKFCSNWVWFVVASSTFFKKFLNFGLLIYNTSSKASRKKLLMYVRSGDFLILKSQLLN